MKKIANEKMQQRNCWPLMDEQPLDLLLRRSSELLASRPIDIPIPP